MEPDHMVIHPTPVATSSFNKTKPKQPQSNEKFPDLAARAIQSARTEINKKISNVNTAANRYIQQAGEHIDEAKLHYQEFHLGAEIHKFIRTSVSFVKNQSEIDNKKYDLNSEKGVAERLLTKYSKEEIEQAIHTLQNSNDMRFNGKKESQFSFDANSFLEALKKADEGKKTPPRPTIEERNIDSEDLEKDMDSGLWNPFIEGLEKDSPVIPPESENPPETKDLKKSAVTDISIKLAALVERKPIEVEFKNKDNQTISMRQEVGHVQYGTDGATFVKGRTSSAEAQKKEKTAELANQGSVVLTKIDEIGNTTDKFLVGRSARTSSAGQIKDSSIGIIADKYGAEGDAGFTEKTDEQGTYFEFQKVDFSFMDSSLSKQALGRVKSGLMDGALFNSTPLEDEKMFNERHIRAIDETWESSGIKKDDRGPYIEHQIQVGGQVKTFREYKPLFMNVVVSSQANDRANLEAAHKANRPNSINMGAQLINNLLEETAKDPVRQKILKSTLTALENCQKNPSTEHMQQLKEELNILKADMQLEKGVNPTVLLALSGVEALVTGSVNGESVHSIAGSKAQILYSFAIADVLKMGASVKCKSGNDRTAIGVALRTASAQYEEVHQEPYDPMTKDPAKQEEFARYFLTSIETFGRGNVLASRGPSTPTNPRPVLKSKSHPLLHHELDHLGAKRQEGLDRLLARVDLI